MTAPLVIKMAVADTGFGTKSDEFNEIIDFISSNIQDGEMYKLEPKALGIHAAAFDIMLILGITANIASIASLLWMAYDKYIAQKSKQGGLYLSMGKGDNKIDLYIGKEYKEKDIFIEVFTKSASQIKDSKNSKEDFDETIMMLKSSDDWEKQ